MVPIREYGLRDTDTKDDCRREASVPMARRVVITGLGTINPLASDVHGYWDGLCNGRSGIGPIELFDASEFKVRFGGEVKGFDPESVLDGKTARPWRLEHFVRGNHGKHSAPGRCKRDGNGHAGGQRP
jgi:hypothetical protein